MPPLGTVAKQLIVVAVGAFVLQMILQQWVGIPVFQLLRLEGGPPGIDDLWRLVGHAFVWFPDPGSVLSLAFVCLGFWWMVSPIELRYGQAGAWRLVALSILAAAIPVRLLGFVLPGVTLFGTGAVFMAAIAVFAFTLRDNVVHLFGAFAIKAMHLLYAVLAFSLLRFLASRAPGPLVGDLGAVAAGWWFVHGGLPRPRGGRRTRRKGPVRRGNLRVVGDDDDADRPRWLN